MIKKSHVNLKEISRERILENTSCYLENYLNPDKKWNAQITPIQRINRIRYAHVDWRAVFYHIKDMDYQDFLKTPYWKAIAAHTKYKAGYRCQLCNSAYDLVTHHRSYDIHGREHAHMQELIVICDNCHNRFHDKIPEYKPNEKDSSNPQESLIILILYLMFFFVFFIYLWVARN